MIGTKKVHAKNLCSQLDEKEVQIDSLRKHLSDLVKQLWVTYYIVDHVS